MNIINVLNVSDAENVRLAYVKVRNKVKAMIHKSKENSKEILVFSRKLIRKYARHMFVLSLKPKQGRNISLTG